MSNCLAFTQKGVLFRAPLLKKQAPIFWGIFYNITKKTEGKMTNSEQQKRLDRKKWKESVENLTDMSGKMDYCDYCQHQAYDSDYHCEVTQAEKETKSLCAKAYNRMRR